MDDLNRTVDRLVEANAVLTDKLERLISFFQICPRCLNGQLVNRELVHRLVNSWRPTFTWHCSSEVCDYLVIKANPDYTPSLPTDEKVVGDQFADLFG